MNRAPFPLLARMTLLAAVLAAAGCTTTTLSVTGHSEEGLNWCGPAAGQTIIGGYPGSPPPSCAAAPPAQADVWASIQTNKVEAAWDSDPAGLRAALMTLCPPSGAWVVFANTDAPTLMHAVAYWMKKERYPVAALLGTDGHNSFIPHREHWVTITEIVTDQDPVTHPTVNLISVSIIDQPPVFGDPPVQRSIMGADWYGSELHAVTLPASTYLGKFVAIIEPPPSKGTAVALPQAVSGELIGPARALDAAREHVRRKPRSRQAFLRNLPKLQPQTPLLVNPDSGGYYLVPFTGAGKMSMAVLVNAYNGAIKEVAEYKPRPILSEQQAITLTTRFLGRKANSVTASLISAPEGGSPLYPVWRIVADSDVLLIGPEGNVSRSSTARVKP